MARIMVCDDDKETSARLRRVLESAGHTAFGCRHTMDVLRRAAANEFDVVAFGSDMSGFGSTNAALALRQIAPRLPLIAFHHTPATLVGTPQHAHLFRVLRRPVHEAEFLLAISQAITGAHADTTPPRPHAL